MTDLILIAVLQSLAVAFTCVLLFRGWRAIPAAGALKLVITLGFLARLVTAQLLFWISYLHLPVARSMQLGDGLWFFATDATLWIPTALHTAEGGLRALVSIPPDIPSPFFVQALAVTTILFGRSTSVGLLLNLGSYLALAAVIAAVARRHERVRPAALVAAAMVGFAPGSFLWAMQPLKDAMFIFLVGLFLAICLVWQALLDRERQEGDVRRIAAIAGLLFATEWAIAGIRWYVGITLFAALPVFVAAALAMSSRRKAAFWSGAAVLLVVSQALAIGGGAALPPPVRAFLRPHSVATPLRELPEGVRAVDTYRRGFDMMLGATAIQRGPLLGRLEARTPTPRPKRAAPAVPVTPPTQSPSAGTTPQARPPVTPSQAKGGRPAMAAPRPNGALAALKRQQEKLPSTHLTRMIAGTTAALLPRFIGQSLGLIIVEGGRGLWPVAECDTILVDALIVFVAVFCVRTIRRSRRSAGPAFLFALAAAVILAIPVAYSVSNMGTMMRLRYTVVLEVALLPLMLREPAAVQSDASRS